MLKLEEEKGMHISKKIDFYAKQLKESAKVLASIGKNYGEITALFDEGAVEGYLTTSQEAKGARILIGNQTAAAKAAGLNRGTFRKKAKAAGLI